MNHAILDAIAALAESGTDPRLVALAADVRAKTAALKAALANAPKPS